MECINLLYGPCGSGKTEAAKAVSEKTGQLYVSVGDVTRREIASNTISGQILQSHLDSITEYPPQLIGKVMLPPILEAATGPGGILDGYPKYPAEAEYFIQQITENQIRLGAVAVIHVSLESALNRIQNRRICNLCQNQTTISSPIETLCPHCHQNSLAVRPDDDPASVKIRYADCQNTIDQVLKILSPYIRIVATINGQDSREKVAQQIQSLFTS